MNTGDLQTISNFQIAVDSLAQAMSYTAYRALVGTLAEQKKTTGEAQTEALVNYTMLNHRRMKRWDKTLAFSEEAQALIMAVNTKITWLVLTESWCGDASPALPVMHKITQMNPLIRLYIILRDEHTVLMDRFLTNGSKSIPKLIAINTEEEVIAGTWGPRSTKATQLVDVYKQQHGTLTSEFKQDLQVWYNKDKGQSVLGDLLKLLTLK